MSKCFNIINDAPVIAINPEDKISSLITYSDPVVFLVELYLPPGGGEYHDL
jgi:hypothetical protein